jgi:hypothetical protein
MNTPIHLLPPNEFKVLKIIRIDGPDWNWFTGHLPYIRKFDPKVYKSKEGDLLDKQILSAIQDIYPSSLLRYNNDILFTNELEDNLKAIEGGTRKEIIIQFFPLLPYENLDRFIGRQLYAYPISFHLRLNFARQNDKVNLINDFFRCEIPFDKIENLVGTISAI